MKEDPSSKDILNCFGVKYLNNLVMSVDRHKRTRKKTVVQQLSSKHRENITIRKFKIKIKDTDGLNAICLLNAF